MDYKVLLLFIASVVIWSTSWLNIKMQLGEVHFYWSIFYRDALSLIICLIITKSLNLKMKFSFKEHLYIFLQGILIFYLNYVFFYYGSQYLISGIVSLISASVIIFNIINSKLILKKNIHINEIIGSILGLTGLSMVIIDNFNDFYWTTNRVNILHGAVLVICGTYAASLGQTISYINQKKNKLPLMQTVTYGLMYATILSLILALLSNSPIIISTNHSYIFSIIYASIAGTVMAFVIYLSLIGKIGTTKSSYIYLISPLISIMISRHYEGYILNSKIIIGMILLLLGNFIVISKNKYVINIRRYNIK